MSLRTLHTLLDRYVVEGRPFGRTMSERNFHVFWSTLLLPGPPVRNLSLLPWNLLPARLRPGPTPA